MGECIFCRIVRREVPASIVHEDDATIAFMDIGQIGPGHVLVATRDHVENLFGLDAAQGRAVMATVQRIAAAVRTAFDPPGLTVLQSNGEAGWQTVFHFHVHVIPRRPGDGARLSWKTLDPPRADLDEYASRLQAALPP